MIEPPQPEASTSRRYFFLVLGVAAAFALVALMLPLTPNPAEPPPRESQIAPQDYRSPVDLTYTSVVLTEQRREAAARAVSPLYTPPDPRLARQQLERLRNVLAYLNNVRADSYATPEQKLSDLAALEDLQLDQDTAVILLGLTDPRWQEVQQETVAVLERVMSSAIRPEGLNEARNRLPSLVSLSLSEAQAGLAATLAAAFVVPNSQLNEAQTEEARQKAREGVTPVTRSFVAGQTVALRGQVLTAADIEALQQLGLLAQERSWQDWVGAGGLALLLVSYLLLYLRRERASVARDPRSFTLITWLFLVILLVARLAIPFHTVIPYVFPLAAYSLTVAALFGVQAALMTTLPLALLVAYGLSNALELTVYYLLGGLFGVLALGRARRLVSFLRAGLVVALISLAVILVYRLPAANAAMPGYDLQGLLTLAIAAGLNGIAAFSLTLLLQYLLAQLLGTVTPMQLVEFTRPDHPLLQFLLHEAPGTYQHSLQVANLAEQAAERIGADPLLTRAGALYHDIGKAVTPFYFIENQLPGFPNPHASLEPQQSAQAIIQHVANSLEQGRKYRLPRRILEFMSEHHGSSLTRYQYVEAVKAAGGDESRVDPEQFRYPGPRPQSRETAILMLADGCEARVRAERPPDEEALRKVIREVINDRVAKGQLDDARLTLRDLAQIADSFVATLRGMYHPRIQYPTLEPPASQAEPSPAPEVAEKTT